MSEPLPFGKDAPKVYPEVEERDYLNEAEKKIVRDRQDGKCAGCSIVPKAWEYDHIKARWKGDTDQSDLSTWQGFGSKSDCDCHQKKTDEEAAERAEMNRKRDLTSQYARREKHGPSLKSRNSLPPKGSGQGLASRGFDRSLRKRMDGTVERVER